MIGLPGVASNDTGGPAQFHQTVKILLIMKGVETPEELARVRDLGVRFAQGFLFACPSAEFSKVDFRCVSSLNA